MNDATRLQLEMFGGGDTTVTAADGRAVSASVVARELKDDDESRSPEPINIVVIDMRRPRPSFWCEHHRRRDYCSECNPLED